MLFNSFAFVIFLLIAFSAFWGIFNRRITSRNCFILLASYVFYGWWDWRFLGLIMLSTVVDYAIGLGIHAASVPSRRKGLLLVSLVVNLGLLGFFKYFNFFVDSFVQAFSSLGVSSDVNTLKVILPVGISFYTFQTLSYTIDIYRRKLSPTKDFVAFAAFVSFFPQLVAGPIERATNLLPQFFTKQSFSETRAIHGMRQILWGFFNKVVIADGCGFYVNQIFETHDSQPGSALALGAILFAFQIYGDFSGYSHIAIGLGKLFGFELRQNFAYPYFSRDVSEFWRRWHISLSSWFRDYVYIPLGGSRGSMNKTIRNVLIVFILSGLWHGANWTFIVWGALHALYFLPLLILRKNRTHLDTVTAKRFLPSLPELGGMLSTFALVSFAWIFFRADTLAEAWTYVQGLFSLSLFSIPTVLLSDGLVTVAFLALCLFIFVLLEWCGRNDDFALSAVCRRLPTVPRWGMYYLMTMVIIVQYTVHASSELTFIYFQF